MKSAINLMFQALHLYLYFGYERYKHLGQFLIIETALKKTEMLSSLLLTAPLSKKVV